MLASVELKSVVKDRQKPKAVEKGERIARKERYLAKVVHLFLQISVQRLSSIFFHLLNKNMMRCSIHKFKEAKERR